MSAASDRRSHVRAIAQRMSARPASVPAVPRMGVITAVAADGTVSVQISGSSTTVTGARCLGHVAPAVGMTVWGLESGGQSASDFLIIGVQDPGSKPWSTDATGFTAAPNFSLTSVRWRVIWPRAEVQIIGARTTSDLANTAAGNPTNTTFLSAIPAALRPVAPQQMAGPFEDTVSARGIFGCVTAAGLVRILAMTGTTDLLNGDNVQLAGSWPLT